MLRVCFAGATFEQDAAEFSFLRDERRTLLIVGDAFEGATFEGDAHFHHVEFWWGDEDSMPGSGPVRRLHAFKDATFRGRVIFDDSTFRGITSFSGATFLRGASFQGATFKPSLLFNDVNSRGDSDFGRVAAREGSFARTTFRGPMMFDGAAIADFDAGEATFKSRVSFGNCDFKSASFKNAIFAGSVYFGAFRVEETADFNGAVFTEPGVAGPFLVLGRLLFDRASFEGPIRIEASADEVSCIDTHFRDRATLDIRWAEITCDGADFARPSLITSSPHVWPDLPALKSPGQRTFRRLQEPDLAMLCTGRAERLRDRPRGHAFGLGELHRPDSYDPRKRGRTQRARVVSLQRTNVENVVLSDVDLQACRFIGAANLERIRITGDATFAQTPPGWRWTSRQALAEEHEWRFRTSAEGERTRLVAENRVKQLQDECKELDRSDLETFWKLKHRWREIERHWHTGRILADEEVSALNTRRAWFPGETQLPVWIKESAPPEPHQIATAYRALRKAQEQAGDEPGAADLYYGESEMRRHDPTRPWAERAILTAYWLISGYGLRGLRALGWLIATILIFGVLLWQVGFDPRPPFARALLFSLESTSSLFRVPELKETSLTYAGETLQVALRLLGPLFFGLALLALRGRIKR
jgi:uncharacterized protein YjbI with pentapeptide repeats